MMTRDRIGRSNPGDRLPGSVRAPGALEVVLRLYVAGEAPNSVLALRNLRTLCRLHCPDNHRIEVVDVLMSPERAWQDGVIVTPTLLRIEPAPQVKIIGNLVDSASVIDLLVPPG